eukprot:755982-Rhodomonas_salina.5
MRFNAAYYWYHEYSCLNVLSQCASQRYLGSVCTERGSFCLVSPRSSSGSDGHITCKKAQIAGLQHLPGMRVLVFDPDVSGGQATREHSTGRNQIQAPTCLVSGCLRAHAKSKTSTRNPGTIGSGAAFDLAAPKKRTFMNCRLIRRCSPTGTTLVAPYRSSVPGSA